jgi:hypothetical protein
VKWVDQVLDVALERKPEPLAEGATQAAAAVPPVPEEKPGASTVVTH